MPEGPEIHRAADKIRKVLEGKVIEGIETTAFGLGEIVTAPFRADFYKPKKKTYYFKKPRLEFHYNSGRFYRE